MNPPATSVEGPIHNLDIDATAVSYSRIRVSGHSWFKAEEPQPVQLTAGVYRLEAESAAFVWFSVGGAGRVDYDSSLDGVLSGRGGTTLTIHGLAVTIDATAMGNSVFLLAGVGWRDSAKPQLVQLLPGSSHVCLVDRRCFKFSLSQSGGIDYESSLEEPLSGRGTSTLTIV